jgi:hypothetical protein
MRILVERYTMKEILQMQGTRKAQLAAALAATLGFALHGAANATDSSNSAAAGTENQQPTSIAADNGSSTGQQTGTKGKSSKGSAGKQASSQSTKGKSSGCAGGKQAGCHGTKGKSSSCSSSK